MLLLVDKRVFQNSGPMIVVIKVTFGEEQMNINIQKHKPRMISAVSDKCSDKWFPVLTCFGYRTSGNVGIALVFSPTFSLKMLQLTSI